MTIRPVGAGGEEDGQACVHGAEINAQCHLLHLGSAVLDRNVLHSDDEGADRNDNGPPFRQEFPRPGLAGRHERFFVLPENGNEWSLTAPV